MCHRREHNSSGYIEAGFWAGPTNKRTIIGEDSPRARSTSSARWIMAIGKAKQRRTCESLSSCCSLIQDIHMFRLWPKLWLKTNYLCVIPKMSIFILGELLASGEVFFFWCLNICDTRNFQATWPSCWKATLAWKWLSFILRQNAMVRIELVTSSIIEAPSWGFDSSGEKQQLWFYDKIFTTLDMRHDIIWHRHSILGLFFVPSLFLKIENYFSSDTADSGLVFLGRWGKRPARSATIASRELNIRARAIFSIIKPDLFPTSLFYY
jgi:hypothetical protein